MVMDGQLAAALSAVVRPAFWRARRPLRPEANWRRGLPELGRWRSHVQVRSLPKSAAVIGCRAGHCAAVSVPGGLARLSYAASIRRPIAEKGAIVPSSTGADSLSTRVR
jgi:hypothetical protein